MVRWRDKTAAGRRVRAGDDQTPSDVSGRAPRRERPLVADAPRPDALIDLTDRAGWVARIEPDPARAAELAERFRSRAARAEAQRDLLRLRARHWSGERLVEEGRITMEWWEHPDADPYAVLGLLPGARLDEAAAARRRIAQSCHPDRLVLGEQDPDVALRRMVAANSAYDRLRRALHPV